MKNSYFIIGGIKYVVIFENGKISFLKEDDNQLVPLNEQELKVIDTLYKYDDRPIIVNTMMDQLIADNKGSLNGKSTQEIVRCIEQLIPENCRGNFYRNLKTLNYDIVDTFKEISPSKDQSSKQWESGITGYYEYKSNSICLDSSFIKKIFELSKEEKNSNSFFVNEYRHLLFHELLHAASTRYDSTANIAFSGFDNTGSENRNVGLTEGFTEAIASANLPSSYEKSSGYFNEIYISLQLAAIVGTDVMLSSYFSANGLEAIKEKLNEYGIDIETANALFDLIELNFSISKAYPDFQNGILANIETIMLKSLLNKVKKESNYEERVKIIENFEKILITPEFLEKNNKDKNKYGGLEDVVNFYSFIKKTYGSNSKIELDEMFNKKVDILQEGKQDENSYK